MKETQVQSLVREDPTCGGAAKPVGQKSPALEPGSCSYSAHVSQLLVPVSPCFTAGGAIAMKSASAETREQPAQ